MARSYTAGESSGTRGSVMSSLAAALSGVKMKSTADIYKKDFFESQRNSRIHTDYGQDSNQKRAMIEAYWALDNVKSDADLEKVFDPTTDFFGVGSGLARAYAQRIVYDAAKAAGGKGLKKVDLNQLRELHKNSEVEFYYEMDSDGNIVTAIQGNRFSVEIPTYGKSGGAGSDLDGYLKNGLPNKAGSAMSQKMDADYDGSPLSKFLENTSSWHNHPKGHTASGFGFPPSTPDFDLFKKLGKKTLYVDGKEGRYAIKPVSRASANWEQALDDYNSLWTSFNSKVTSAKTDSEVDAANSIRAFNEAAKNILAKHGFEYSFEPSPDFKRASGNG